MEGETTFFEGIPLKFKSFQHQIHTIPSFFTTRSMCADDFDQPVEHGGSPIRGGFLELFLDIGAVRRMALIAPNFELPNRLRVPQSSS